MKSKGTCAPKQHMSLQYCSASALAVSFAFAALASALASALNSSCGPQEIRSKKKCRWLSGSRQQEEAKPASAKPAAVVSFVDVGKCENQNGTTDLATSHRAPCKVQRVPLSNNSAFTVLFNPRTALFQPAPPATHVLGVRVPAANGVPALQM